MYITVTTENGEIISGQDSDSLTVHWDKDSLSGKLILIVENERACKDSIIYDIFIGKMFAPLLNFDYGSENICAFTYAILNANAGYCLYMWNTGDTTQTLKVKKQGNYFCI